MINSLMLSTAMLVGQTQVLPPATTTAPPTYILVQNGNGNGNGNGEAKAEAPAAEEPKEDDRYALMKALDGTHIGDIMKEHRLSISGWATASYTHSENDHYINNSRGNPGNGTVVWNDRANHVNLQQLWVRMDRALDTESKEVNFGFRGDVLFGTDYRYTMARGLFNSQLQNGAGNQNFYGVDPVQFYVNAWLPNLFKGTEVRVGRVFCPWGFESLETVSSPFMSKSFAFNFAPPFTHTGVLFISNISDNLVVKYGLTGGNDVFIDDAMRLQTIGAVTYTTCDKKQTATFGWAIGNGRFIQDQPFNPTTYGTQSEPLGRNNFNSFDFVYTNALTDKLTVAAEFIYCYQTNAPIGVVGGTNAGFGTANWMGLPVYLQYKINDCLTAQARVEWFEDTDGQRTGERTSYFAQTYGLSWLVSKGVIFRPEVRFDHSSDNNYLYNGNQGIVTAGADLTIRY